MNNQFSNLPIYFNNLVKFIFLILFILLKTYYFFHLHINRLVYECKEQHFLQIYHLIIQIKVKILLKFHLLYFPIAKDQKFLKQSFFSSIHHML